MGTLLKCADSVIRSDLRRLYIETSSLTVGHLIAIIALFGAIYGAAMGSYGGVQGQRSGQVLSSAVKVPLLLLVTFGISLPSFFIFMTLFGLREEFGKALRALLAGQAGLTVILASLAPFTLFWNVASAAGHSEAILFNGAMFGVATLGSQVLLRRSYRPLLAKEGRHLRMLRLWGIVYTFVGIQMGWVLRPFVGDPNRPFALFREDTWGNAYLIVFQLIQNLFR